MAIVGLKFDLDPWRKGVASAATLVKKGLSDKTLGPFDKAVRRTVFTMRKTFAPVGKYIGGVLRTAFSPLTALLGAGGTIFLVKKALTESLAAYREYSDSVTTLRAAIESLGEGIDTAPLLADAKQLGDQLRLAMGIQGGETNRALATLLTRGFDPAQARQLAILAANYAKTTGKELKDVTKQIADAANGSVDAIKELGVEITVTGDRVADAEAAVIALKGAYGDIGADLANPSERLAAAWNELYVALGERISPILEPIIQGFADLVTGLTQTEEGREYLDQVAESLGKGIEMATKFTKGIISFTEMVIFGAKATVAAVLEAVLEIQGAINGLISSLPASGLIGEKLFGADFETISRNQKDMAKVLGEDMRANLAQFEEAQAAFMSGQGTSGSALRALDQIMQEGADTRNQSRRDLMAEMDATKGQGFAGLPAMEQQRQQEEAEEERQYQAQKARMQKMAADAQRQREQQVADRDGAQEQLNQQVRGRGNVSEGTRVSLTIQSTRPDRYRKARGM
jgi:hypothetical protein